MDKERQTDTEAHRYIQRELERGRERARGRHTNTEGEIDLRWLSGWADAPPPPHPPPILTPSDAFLLKCVRTLPPPGRSGGANTQRGQAKWCARLHSAGRCCLCIPDFLPPKMGPFCDCAVVQPQYMGRPTDSDRRCSSQAQGGRGPQPCGVMANGGRRRFASYSARPGWVAELPAPHHPPLPHTTAKEVDAVHPRGRGPWLGSGCSKGRPYHYHPPWMPLKVVGWRGGP